jgi:hypothetical protein
MQSCRVAWDAGWLTIPAALPLLFGRVILSDPLHGTPHVIFQKSHPALQGRFGFYGLMNTLDVVGA